MSKVALVTGASSGIGEAVAGALLDEGYVVFAGARRVDRMRGLEKKGARLLELDVSHDDSIREAIDKIVSQEGRIDVLVNNAGYGSFGALEDVPPDEARRQFEVNVFGLARLIQLTTPHMRKQGSGRIVNITSIGGKIYQPMGAWYHSTKYAVEGLSDCLRLELRPFGIDVIIIEPGGIKTEWAGIAQESVMKYSGSTAYADQAKSRAAVLTGHGYVPSEPSVISDVILKALKAARPKARYFAGAGALPILTFRKLFSDRVMDWILDKVTERFGSGK